MGKRKKAEITGPATYRPRARQPASPTQIETAASRIASVLIDFSDDESDRIMAAVYAINGDHEALTFYAERVEQRATEDAPGRPECDEEILAAVRGGGVTTCDARGVIRRG